MNTAVSMEPGAGTSPQWIARAAGLFWLTTMLAGIFSMVAWGKIVVPGNAAATTANILAKESLFRLGATADLLGVLSYIGVTLFIYELLAPVNRKLSLLAAFFSLVGCALGALGCVLQLAPLTILSSAPALNAFTPGQVRDLAFLAIRVRVGVNDVALVFFGLHCLLLGYLICRSTFLPRFVGVLMVIAGLGWLTFLFPTLAKPLMPWNMAPGILGEGTLLLWLIFMGVNAPRWRAQASAALERPSYEPVI